MPASTCLGGTSISIAGFPLTVVNAGVAYVAAGRDYATGNMMQGVLVGNTTSMQVTSYNNGNPTSTDTLGFTGTYESN